MALSSSASCREGWITEGSTDPVVGATGRAIELVREELEETFPPDCRVRVA